MMRQSSILDEIHSSLTPTLWDNPTSPKPVLKPKAAHFIKRHIYEALEANGYSHPDQWLRLFVTGSLTTYQYGPESDVDVSLFVGPQLPEWSRAELIGVMTQNVDGTILPGTQFPLQCFVVAKHLDPSDLYKPGLRSGYDLDKMQWLVPPEPGRSHDVQAQQNGFYVYALEQADKMERLLRYEPDKAIQFWHQLHRKRQLDQRAGRGDYSESNIVYKFLAKRGLLPAISQASGEYIAKTAAWHDHFVQQLGPIAHAYDALPSFDPAAVPAWQELAADSHQRANELRNRLHITETDEPEPYANAHEMFNDIDKGNFVVSRANSEHPIWTPDQNVDFRIVHDVLGHHPTGGDFGWQGENQACGNHFGLLSPNAQQALMTECLGQTGSAIRNGGFGPQKVGLMNDLIAPAQQAYNMQAFGAAMPEGGFCHRHLRHGIYRLPS